MMMCQCRLSVLTNVPLVGMLIMGQRERRRGLCLWGQWVCEKSLYLPLDFSVDLKQGSGSWSGVLVLRPDFGHKLNICTISI